LIVIDASAEIAVLLNIGPEVEGVRERISRPGESLHVPHLFEIEVLHALRSLGLRDTLSPERARLALSTGSTTRNSYATRIPR
jgi:predicted nucleic acid-binding protein